MVDNTVTTSRRQVQITYNLPHNLSGIPYDIKVVFASPLVRGDSYLEDALEEREVAEAELNYYQSVSSGFKNNPDQLEDFDGTINSMVMDTVTVAEGFNGSGSGYRGQGFPVCAYGEQEPRVQLTLMGRRGRGTPYLLIDCILLVPRPDLIEEEDN